MTREERKLEIKKAAIENLANNGIIPSDIEKAVSKKAAGPILVGGALGGLGLTSLGKAITGSAATVAVGATAGAAAVGVGAANLYNSIFGTSKNEVHDAVKREKLYEAEALLNTLKTDISAREGVKDVSRNRRTKTEYSSLGVPSAY